MHVMRRTGRGPRRHGGEGGGSGELPVSPPAGLSVGGGISSSSRYAHRGRTHTPTALPRGLARQLSGDTADEDDGLDEEGMDEEELSAALGALGLRAVGAAPSASLRGFLKGVVKIFATFAAPDFGKPWSMTSQQRGTASGFCVAGKRILTNAHAVAYQTSVQVRKHGDAEKYTARVIAVAHEVDVAILAVEDDAFWHDAVQLQFGSMPRLQQSVFVVGFPVGGETISITSGVVSRIDFDQYAHSTRESLVCQVDAAINPGNSGGPALSGGKVVGIAFQSLQGAEGVGYVIPVPVVQHVLEDVKKHGKITGFARLGFVYQPMENPHLKAFLKVPKGVTGILVIKVLALSNLSGKLQRNDVVAALDGHKIADDGTVEFQEESRIDVGYLLTRKFLGDPIELLVYREGVKMTITSTVEDVPDLIPPTLYDRKPSYFVHAGLVFTPCTEPFVETTFGEGGGAPLKLLAMAQDAEAEAPGQQVVVLASLLSHPINVGYEPDEYTGSPLKAVDGKKIKNMLDLAFAVRDAKGPFITFTIAEDLLIALPLEASRAATADVLEQHAIPAAMSSDLANALSAGERPAPLEDGAITARAVVGAVSATPVPGNAAAAVSGAAAAAPAPAASAATPAASAATPAAGIAETEATPAAAAPSATPAPTPSPARSKDAGTTPHDNSKSQRRGRGSSSEAGKH